MLLGNRQYEIYIKQYETDTTSLTEEEQERNRRSSTLRGAIDLIINMRNMGIHVVEDIADEVQIHEADYKIFIEVNKVLVKHMLNLKPLLMPNQHQPVGFFSVCTVLHSPGSGPVRRKDV